jgi:hypothetical protein
MPIRSIQGESNMKPIYDIKGREIKPFDLIKLYHFTGSRRKKYYMYKWVLQFGDYLFGMHLEKPIDFNSKFGNFSLSQSLIDNSYGEIIQGSGYEFGFSFEDRPKIKREIEVSDEE